VSLPSAGPPPGLEIHRTRSAPALDLTSPWSTALRIHALFPLAVLTRIVSAQSAEEPCDTAEDARALAESETLGEAVTTRRIIQTDGTKGWEVLVHMPGLAKGWRVIIDRDLAKVRWKEAIWNPPSRRVVVTAR